MKVKEIGKSITLTTGAQLVNYLAPLITLPHLSRVFSPNIFGHIAIVNTLISLCIILFDFGLTTIGTKQIANSGRDKIQQNKIIISIIHIKIIGSLVFSTLYIAYISIIKPEYTSYYLLSTLTFISATIFPNSILLGLQYFKTYSFTSAISRITASLCVIFLIHSEDQLNLVAILNSLPLFTLSLISYYNILRKTGAKLLEFNFYYIRNTLKKCKSYFSSTIFMGLYSNTSFIIASRFVNSHEIGIYSAADKIPKVIYGIYNNISQTILAILSNNNDIFEKQIKYSFNILKLSTFLAILSGAFIYSFSQNIILLIFGNEFTNSIIILKEISFLPVLLIYNNTLVNLFIIPHYEFELLKITRITAIIGICISTFLVLIYGISGFIMSLYINEFIMASYTTYILLVYLKRTK